MSADLINFRKAQKAKTISGRGQDALNAEALAKGIITADEKALLEKS